MRGRQAPRVCALWLALSGCTPTHDWREVRPDGAALSALFPCRPQQLSRRVDLEGVNVPMQVHVCRSGDETLAVAFVDVDKPGQVSAVMRSLQSAAKANFSATQIQASGLQVPGMTPNPNAALVSMRGASAQGEPVAATAAFFVRGLRVYQATIFGTRVDPEVLQTFIAGLKLQ